MANVFKRVGNQMIDSPHVIVMFLVFLAGFIISIMIMYEDYSTSRLGYEALPTLKANMWIIPVVAFLPQLAQAIFAYNYLFDTKKRWSLFIAACCFLFDMGTDVYFKSNHLQSPAMVGYAIFEGLVIYTFGSEILMTVSFGMVLTLFPRFWEEFSVFLEMALNAIIHLFKIVVGTFSRLLSETMDAATGQDEQPRPPAQRPIKNKGVSAPAAKRVSQPDYSKYRGDGSEFDM